MPFDFTVNTKNDGEYNWYDLPDSDRPELQELADRFVRGDFDPQAHLIINGPKTLFSKPWSEIGFVGVLG